MGSIRRLIRTPQLSLLLFIVTAGGAGAVARLASANVAADWAWGVATASAALPLGWSIVRDALRRKAGVDVVALLALAGALVLREFLVGAVIAVMYAGGRALEAYASAHAERELKSLLERAPRVVHRYEGEGLVDRPLDAVSRGDLLLVTTGEVLPVDGLVAARTAVLDESALTGEPGPVERGPDDAVRSGAVNAGPSFDLRATTTAAESTYAGIIRLVREAQTSKAPFVRLADRYALAFVPLTLVVAGAAWAFSGQFSRALAVLVVATPCPLILAAPIAIVAGISRAARRGIIVKGGGALETLGRARVLLLDKTGTLTTGHPAVAEVVAPAGDPGELLRLAASLDQASQHVLAGAIVHHAREQGVTLTFPANPVEELGRGLRGLVDGREVAVGRAEWVAAGASLPSWVRRLRRRAGFEGLATVFVAVDGRLAGAILLDDRIRPESPWTLRRLRREGVRRIVMVTGDRGEVASLVGAAVGIDEVVAERTPAEKVEAVRDARTGGVTVMVGDGVNDAPALAAADVGVAMGARGATASSEAADVVLVVDRLERLVDALGIAHRSRRIAVESVLAGMGLSIVAMFLAAAGKIPPVAGAVLQEAIDVAVILNALRALRTPGAERRPPAAQVRLGRRLQHEHAELRPLVKRIRATADRLERTPPSKAIPELREVHEFLVTRVLPHEAGEESEFFAAIARRDGGEDRVAALRRVHAEIVHLTRLLGKLLDDVEAEGLVDDDLPELRRILYGLYAILQLHIAEEDEELAPLAGFDDSPGYSAGRLEPAVTR